MAIRFERKLDYHMNDIRKVKHVKCDGRLHSIGKERHSFMSQVNCYININSNTVN